MSEYQDTSLRFCAECLALGIHLLIFQWNFISVCPLHRLPLTTRCRRCRQPVPYRFNADTFKLPGHCPSCLGAMMDITTVDRLNHRTLKMFQNLLDFTRSLQQSLRKCDESKYITGLGCWFRIFPATYPALRIDHRQFDAWLCPAPEFNRPQCETAIADIQRCYRSIRRGLWRQLSRIERKQLCEWVLNYPGPISQPVPSALNCRQVTFLFWRMVWEGRSTPGLLFQRTLAPYTGLYVWRLFNQFEEEYEDDGRITALLSKELQAFNEALNYTYKICDQLARRMLARNQICFDRNWIEIPSNFLPSPPFFHVRPGR